MDKIRADFDAGFCSDDEAKKEIREMFVQRGYLMDPHTADAYAVLKSRRAGEDAFPTVVVSTASPFKFCDSVLDALGTKTDASGAELLDELSAATGRPAPRPLARLKEMKPRFDGCVSKGNMAAAVMDFIDESK